MAVPRLHGVCRPQVTPLKYIIPSTGHHTRCNMHFSLHSALFASTAFLALVNAAPTPAPASPDAFSDSSIAPDPDTTDVESSKTESTASKAQCTPTSYATPRTFQLKNELAPGCLYQSFIDVTDTSADKQQGIQQCKNRCTKEANCRTFSWYLDSTRPDVGTCTLAADFYDPSVIQCDNSTTSTYDAVYNVTNWTPRDPLVPNGDFESGCFKPWFFQDFTSDGSMKKTVVKCDKSVQGDCAPNGGKNYVRITGNGALGDNRDHIDAYIGQQPALTAGVTYKLTAQVRGDSGEFRFTYPVHTSVKIRAQATKNWQKVEGTFTANGNVGTFLIQMDAPDKANFAIDNVKIVAV